MMKKAGGVVLLLVAALMLLGFVRTGASLASPTALFALLLTVALPAGFGATLLRGALRGGSPERMRALRQQTIDAEILKLAMGQGGRLTEVEVSSALALPAGEAKASLDGMVARQAADLEVTESGVLVYTFHEARHLGEKQSARGLLDAR
jgi:hypothetical protein